MKLLSKIMVVIAIVFSVLLFFSFVAMSLYNTWSPGCSFGCVGDSGDQFESNLILTWFIGLVVTVAAWVLAIFLDEEL